MKKSPFTLLREAIENELLNTSLQLQSHLLGNSEINSEFIIGYSEALKFMLMKADFIYKYGSTPKF